MFVFLYLHVMGGINPQVEFININIHNGSSIVLIA